MKTPTQREFNDLLARLKANFRSDFGGFNFSQLSHHQLKQLRELHPTKKSFLARLEQKLKEDKQISEHFPHSHSLAPAQNLKKFTNFARSSEHQFNPKQVMRHRTPRNR